MALVRLEKTQVSSPPSNDLIFLFTLPALARLEPQLPALTNWAEEIVSQRARDGRCKKGGEGDHGQARVLVASISNLHGKVEQVGKEVVIAERKRKEKGRTPALIKR